MWLKYLRWYAEVSVNYDVSLEPPVVPMSIFRSRKKVMNDVPVWSFVSLLRQAESSARSLVFGGVGRPFRSSGLYFFFCR